MNIPYVCNNIVISEFENLFRNREDNLRNIVWNNVVNTLVVNVWNNVPNNVRNNVYDNPWITVKDNLLNNISNIVGNNYITDVRNNVLIILKKQSISTRSKKSIINSLTSS